MDALVIYYYRRWQRKLVGVFATWRRLRSSLWEAIVWYALSWLLLLLLLLLSISLNQSTHRQNFVSVVTTVKCHIVSLLHQTFALDVQVSLISCISFQDDSTLVGETSWRCPLIFFIHSRQFPLVIVYPFGWTNSFIHWQNCSRSIEKRCKSMHPPICIKHVI